MGTSLPLDDRHAKGRVCDARKGGPPAGGFSAPCIVANGSDTPDRVGKGLWRSW
jgi:hypothetical protein